MNGVLCVDVETCSALPIKAGAAAYSAHPSTIAWCVEFGYWDGNRGTDYLRFGWRQGERVHPFVREWIEGGGVVLAHNCLFELSIFENLLVPEFGFPRVELSQWRDSMAEGLAMNLPPALEGLAKYLGCPTQKDMIGAALMKRLATAEDPGDGGYVYPEPTDDEFEALVDYCWSDVETTLDCWQRLRKLSPAEFRTWQADLAVNARGVYVDRKFSKSLERMADRRFRALAAETDELTLGLLDNSTSTPKLKGWLQAKGVELPTKKAKRKTGVAVIETCDAEAVEEILTREALAPDVRRVLENRSEANKRTSLAKLKRLDEMVSTDGRLRGAFSYCGTHTGRWASYGVQLHNLPKNRSEPVQTELAEFAVEHEDDELLGVLEDQPMRALSMQLRSMLSAPPGFDLIAGDYSAIECRVLAWLAGQTDTLELFEAGEDVYVHTARLLGSESRPLGKVSELGLGFGMGQVRFHEHAHGFGVRLSRIEARQYQQLWRANRPAIVAFWGTAHDSCVRAIRNPGSAFAVGDRIVVKASKSCLAVRLPSGRLLRYWSPRVVPVTKKVQVLTDEGHLSTAEFDTDEVQFRTMGPDRKSMVRTSTYGGKLVENFTQATARDLLADALARFEASGTYVPVAHVHDSLATQVVEGAGDVREFELMMAETPAWAATLPNAVEAYRAKRFRG